MYTAEQVREFSENPTPDQMHNLARVVVLLAKDQGRLKPSRYADNARTFVPESVENLIESDTEFGHTLHTFSGRVGRYGLYGTRKRWGMKLVERFWSEIGGSVDTSRTVSDFEWTDFEVLKAERTILTVHKSGDHIQPRQEIEIKTADDFLAQEEWFIRVREMWSISQADCDRLMNDIGTFATLSHERAGVKESLKPPVQELFMPDSWYDSIQT